MCIRDSRRVLRAGTGIRAHCRQLGLVGDVGFQASSRSLIGAAKGIWMLTKKTLLVVFCMLVLPMSLVYGQANGSFAGTVSDKTGSVITGAKITITSQATGISRDAKTDDT